MKRAWRRLILSFLAASAVAACAVFALLRAVAESKPPEPPKPPLANNTVQAVAPAVNILPYLSKYAIEIPTEKWLAALTVPAATPAAPAFVNPKVEPGKVRWHKDFATACGEAKKSGKPVLLFQMMGKLDDQFC